MGMTVDTIGECYATVSICGEEVKVKAQFLEVLKRYEGQCGSDRDITKSCGSGDKKSVPFGYRFAKKQK